MDNGYKIGQTYQPVRMLVNGNGEATHFKVVCVAPNKFFGLVLNFTQSLRGCLLFPIAGESETPEEIQRRLIF